MVKLAIKYKKMKVQNISIHIESMAENNALVHKFAKSNTLLKNMEVQIGCLIGKF
jgi:hypothetical protein